MASLETARAEIVASYPETTVTSIPANVGSKDSITALWKRINDTGVTVDVLINNAGTGGKHSKIGEGDVDNWWAVQVSLPSSSLELPRNYGGSR